MDKSAEMEALRAEQRRLRLALDQLDERLEALDSRVEPEANPPPIPDPAPAAKPVFSSPEAPRPAVALTPTVPTSAVEKPSEHPEPPAMPRESLELRLGRIWLVRVGIIILLTGFVFLGNYAYHELIGRLGPVGKLALLYLAGGGLCALGAWLARRESLQNYGRVLVAGGCATIYYSTFAAHFVATLRVIDSAFVGGMLLLALGAAFVAWADRLRSQTLAAATIALSFYTAAINQTDSFSLFSNLVISLAAVILLARRQWVSVSFLSLLGTYGSFLFWRVQQNRTLFPTAVEDSLFWSAVLFPAAYWAVHTAAVLMRRVKTFDPAARPVFLTLNNAAFFALAGPVIAGNYPHTFWLAAVIFGAILVALAAVAARTSPGETYFDGSYLTQGLALLFVGLLYKFTAWQLAISFALLSATLISLGRLRHGGIFRFFAGIAAVIATTTALGNVLDDAMHARLVAYAVAAILTGAAWLLKRYAGMPPSIDWRAVGFTLLAGILVVFAGFDGDLQTSSLRVLGIALAVMLSLCFHRLPEAVYVAQPVALCGQAILLWRMIEEPVTGMGVCISAASALAFVHLWQWRKNFPLAGRKTWQALHSIVPVILALTWTFARFAPASRAPILALLAILILIYALITRTWILAVAGIPFTLVAFAGAFQSIVVHSAWHHPAMAIGLLAAQSLVLTTLGNRTPISQDVLRRIARAIRAAAMALLVGMVFAYLPDDTWFLVILSAAFVFFLLTCARQSREAAFYAVALAWIAAITWLTQLPVAPAQWPDFFGFALLAAAQRIGKRRLAQTPWFTPQIQAALCTAAVLGTWVLLHRLIGTVAGGFLITMSWSLLAFVVLAGGFALKERAYRLLGLTILAAAVGRIVLIDVWQLETLFRILSFIVLGGVLLALGFLYNRHAEAMRRWL